MSDLTDLEEELDELYDLDYLLNSNEKPTGCCLFSFILLLVPAALVAGIGTIAKLML